MEVVQSKIAAGTVSRINEVLAEIQLLGSVVEQNLT
jgi:hypothetical protein